jgi:hypothetical protein
LKFKRVILIVIRKVQQFHVILYTTKRFTEKGEMKVGFLKKVNYILAIIGLGLAVTHFFIKGIELPISIVFAFLLVFFLLIGIEKVKNREVKSGYFYIGAATIMSLAVLKDLYAILL